MTTLEWLKRLVAIDTVSRNSNLALIEVLADWFKQHSIATRITRDPNEAKANLLAIIPGHRGDEQGGLVLSGHTDVVPVDGQKWDTNPFEVVEKDDKVYGRGTCDMKGFLAVILALTPAFKKMNLSKPLYLAFSYDEEIGCRGAPHIVADMQQVGMKPAACIVGEPTDMHIIVAHKGMQVYRCRVYGQATHSSLTPQGCNAIEYAAKLISYIRNLADELRQTGPQDNYFDVPFTTITTNLIQGGSATNIVPAYCEFFFEFRHLPEVQPNSIIDKINDYVKNQLLPTMQREKADAKIEIENMSGAPSFETTQNALIEKLARTVSGEKDKRKVAYATEAGLFQKANIPTIICGPGSIEQAHRANEFVMLDQLKKCETFLIELVRNFN